LESAFARRTKSVPETQLTGSTRQVTYKSKDGTEIPMFLVGKKGFSPKQGTPGELATYLYGYGGFNIALTPEFSARYGISRLQWMEMGGVFAGLAIQAQRPFEVGDWIQFEGGNANVGRVVEINWRATRVVTVDGQPLGYAKPDFRNPGFIAENVAS